MDHATGPGGRSELISEVRTHRPRLWKLARAVFQGIQSEGILDEVHQAIVVEVEVIRSISFVGGRAEMRLPPASERIGQTAEGSHGLHRHHGLHDPGAVSARRPSAGADPGGGGEAQAGELPVRRPADSRGIAQRGIAAAAIRAEVEGHLRDVRRSAATGPLDPVGIRSVQGLVCGVVEDPCEVGAGSRGDRAVGLEPGEFSSKQNRSVRLYRNATNGTVRFRAETKVQHAVRT